MKGEGNDFEDRDVMSNPFAKVFVGSLEGHLDAINCLETLCIYQSSSFLKQNSPKPFDETKQTNSDSSSYSTRSDNEITSNNLNNVKTDLLNTDISDIYNSLILSGGDDGTVRVWSTNFEIDEEVSSTAFVSLPISYNKDVLRSKMCYRREIFNGLPITSIKTFSYTDGALDKSRISCINSNTHGKDKTKSLLDQCYIQENKTNIIHRILVTAGTSLYILNFDIEAYKNEPIIIVREPCTNLSNFALDEINAVAVYNDRTKRDQHLHLLDEDKEQNTIITVDDSGDICLIKVPLRNISSFSGSEPTEIDKDNRDSTYINIMESAQVRIVQKLVYPSNIQSSINIKPKSETISNSSVCRTISNPIDDDNPISKSCIIPFSPFMAPVSTLKTRPHFNRLRFGLPTANLATSMEFILF